MTYQGIQDNSEAFILVASIGLFEGSLIGAMANVMPFQVVLACAAFMSLTVWRQSKVSFFPLMILVGGLAASGLGSMSNIIPWGMALFFAVQIPVYAWKSGSGASGLSNIPSLITVPFYIIISVGLFYGSSYSDFCIVNGNDVCSDPANWVRGFPTIWAGCVNTCVITPFTLLKASVFSSFINSAATGDYVGFVT